MLLAILRIELDANRLERFRFARLDLLELDQVVTELRFDRPGNVTHVHGEQRVAERARKILLLDETELAAIGGGAVLGILLRELREVLARARLGQHALGLLARTGIVVAAHRDQDVPGAPALVEHVAVAVVIVKLAQFVFGRNHLRRDLLEPQFGVFE